MRILVSNCESAKHGAICRTFVQTTRHAFVGKCPWLCLHRATGIFARICDDCHDDELRRSEECVSCCAARAGAEPQRQRKPGNPANYVASKAGNKLKRQRKPSNTRKTDAFPGPKGAQRHRAPKAPPNPVKRRKTTCV